MCAHFAWCAVEEPQLGREADFERLTSVLPFALPFSSVGEGVDALVGVVEDLDFDGDF